MTDRPIRVTTALAVAAVAAVAAVISYRRHAYELVSTHGETGVTVGWCRSPWAGSSWTPANAIGRRHRWRLGAGIAATIGVNLAHDLGHGRIGPPWRWPAPSNWS